jgi:hypothetical protein
MTSVLLAWNLLPHGQPEVWTRGRPDNGPGHRCARTRCPRAAITASSIPAGTTSISAGEMGAWRSNEVFRLSTRIPSR